MNDRGLRWKGVRREDPALPRPLAAAVLRLIWHERRLSRADIAQRANLSRSTVSEVIDELLPTGLVTEVGTGESRGGRRPIVLEFRDDAAVILGVDMGATHVGVALTDLRGRCSPGAPPAPGAHRPRRHAPADRRAVPRGISRGQPATSGRGRRGGPQPGRSRQSRPSLEPWSSGVEGPRRPRVPAERPRRAPARRQRRQPRRPRRALVGRRPRRRRLRLHQGRHRRRLRVTSSTARSTAAPPASPARSATSPSRPRASRASADCAAASRRWSVPPR